VSSESQSPEPKLVAPDEQSSTESRFFELDVTGLTREEEARLLQRLTREITDAFPLPLMVRRTVVLPAGNQGERIAAVPDPIVVNPPPPGDAPQPEQPKRSIAELDTLRWLFTVVLGFALTNGTRIFWTGSLTDKELRSWSALYGSLDFA
jgi:hypothetical protein